MANLAAAMQGCGIVSWRGGADLCKSRLVARSERRGSSLEESRVNSRLGPVSELTPPWRTPLQRQGRTAASAATHPARGPARALLTRALIVAGGSRFVQEETRCKVRAKRFVARRVASELAARPCQ